MRKVSNRENILDSRDVIAARDELAEEISSERLCEIEERLEAIEARLEESLEPDTRDALRAERDALESEQKRIEGGDLSVFEHQTGYAEWKALNDFIAEFDGYADPHGETLILDSYFPDYAESLAEDVCPGYNKARNTWPFTCVDWEAAAKELQADYSSAEYDGATYWYRS